MASRMCSASSARPTWTRSISSPPPASASSPRCTSRVRGTWPTATPRASGRQGVCIAQNGPGVTNFVTSTAAAYWAHSPVVVITPETGSGTMGLGGFQETDQLPIFSKITKFQGHVNNVARMAEITGRCFDMALAERGPTQLNIPRDYFYGEIDCEIPRPQRVARGPGAEESLDEAAEILSKAKFPVILAGGGVIMSGGIEEAKELAEFLQAPGRQQLPAQRQLPRRSPAVVRPARLPGLQGGHEDHRQGRRGAGARHAPRALRHAAAARARLLAEEGQDHPGRQRPPHARAWSSRSRSACAAMPRPAARALHHRLANRDVAARKNARRSA